MRLLAAKFGLTSAYKSIFHSVLYNHSEEVSWLNTYVCHGFSRQGQHGNNAIIIYFDLVRQWIMECLQNYHQHYYYQI